VFSRFKKARAVCEKIGSDEDGVKYLCTVEGKEYLVKVKTTGEINIAPTLLLPDETEYRAIIEELKSKGEKVLL